MTILVLGPSKWRPDHHPRIPGWVPSHLPLGWRRRGAPIPAPIDVRACIVGRLSALKSAATMMEMHPKHPGETHRALFHRIIRAHGVERYFVYWPSGAQRSGTDVELGFLLGSLQRGESPDVRVLVETAAGSVHGGRFESHEMGARTTYYEDLVGFGCPILEWRSHRELWTALAHHARP